MATNKQTVQATIFRSRSNPTIYVSRGINTRIFGYTFRPKYWLTSGGESSSLIHYQWVSYKELQEISFKSSPRTNLISLHFPISSVSYKELQDISFKSSPRTNLISTHFPISSHEQETRIFPSPRCLLCVCQP